MPSYPGISSEAFRHPLDHEAEQALRSLPGFDLVARKFLEVAVDRPQYLYHMGNSVQVGPRQYASLYHLLRECLRDLDIYPEPALFVSQSYQVNAFTIGQEQPTIVLTTALLDLLNETELRVVIAHELGHLKCGHSILTQMAIWTISAASVVGQMTMGLSNMLISNALVMAFYEWKRKAELSADRAALIATDDLNTVLMTMVKVAGGSSKHLHELSLDEFKKQAREYQALDADAMNQAYKFFLYNNLPQGMYSSHPFPVERASYLQEWAASADYQAIRRGDYRRDSATGAVNVQATANGGAPQGNHQTRSAPAESEADRLRRQIEDLQRELDRFRAPR